MKYYAGIGSRKTPYNVICRMAIIGDRLRQMGYICRTGGADGADAAFLGVSCGKVELYLPWPGFNGHTRGINAGEDMDLRDIALDHYEPKARWHSLSSGVRKLMTRNVAQILGLFPLVDEKSEFVICWTPDGKGGGGTGQALRVARAYGVPVYDLATKEGWEKANELIGPCEFCNGNGHFYSTEELGPCSCKYPVAA